MATGVKVTVTDHAIISALNTPGGDVYQWREEIGRAVKAEAVSLSPINDPMNAEHRGGEVGVFAKSFDWDRRGSSGHHVVARVTNDAPHAIYVELGRSASSKMQIFSWSEYGGAIVRVGGPSEVQTDERGNVLGRRRGLSPGEAAFNQRVRSLPKKIGESTGARAGQHVLARALVAVMGSQGITASVDL